MAAAAAAALGAEDRRGDEQEYGLGVVGDWRGGQSTLFVTLIDPSQHFTFLHLTDQSSKHFTKKKQMTSSCYYVQT